MMKKFPANFDQIVQELIISGLKPEIIRRPICDTSYDSISADSRQAAPGILFCALEGQKNDGHNLIHQIANVIGIALIERTTPEIEDLPCGLIKVSSTRAAWAQLASFFAGHPSQNLCMVGITGTNGKTSTTWMLRSVLRSLGFKTASLGTLGLYIDDEVRDSLHTTPDPDVLYPLLQEATARGITHVVMEVSSHSLVQEKVRPIKFNAAAFTSFSQDHLDFHANMDEYLQAKLSLFLNHLKPNATSLIHEKVLCEGVASATFKDLKDRKQVSIFSYGSLSLSSDYSIEQHSNHELGSSDINILKKNDLDHGRFVIPMVGDIFCENFAAAIILSHCLMGLSIQELAHKMSLATIDPVPGRLQIIRATKRPWRPLVFIDYAHTPDALEKAICTLKSPHRKITAIFGCAGDRDKLKRPLMGRIASTLANVCVVTSDNPRSEDPNAIIADIFSGIADSNRVTQVTDRSEAIHQTVLHSGAKTTVLVAGKGHETYQIIGTQKKFFSDEKEAYKALSQPKTWLVIGAGISGLSAAKLLADSGEKVYLCDDRALPEAHVTSPLIEVISKDKIPWAGIQHVVKSPGISKEHPVASQARSHQIECISEIDLGFDRYQGSIIAVTGTNGKSTTVAMTEFLLKQAGRAANACGNIGIPPTSLPLFERDADHTAVVELSSYQLDDAYAWPAIGAAFTSFSFDHIERHKTIDAYFHAKWKITEWLGNKSILVLSSDVAQFAESQKVLWPSCRTVVISTEASMDDSRFKGEIIRITGSYLQLADREIDLSAYRLIGRHNYFNAVAAALLAAHRLGVDFTDLLPGLSLFKGLPFRCEVVFHEHGRLIVNDSKSTNLESTLVAMSVASRPGILLMGGKGKGESYKGLAAARDKIKLLITFGASRHEIMRDQEEIPSESFEKMGDAVLRALQLARDNNLDVIFSPGCASFDEFRNFEHRGEIFNELVSRFHGSQKN